MCPSGLGSPIACGPGFVSGPDRLQCTPCPAGSYEALPGVCASCPLNAVSTAGARNCTACPPGMFSSDDRRLCFACGPGTFRAAGGSVCVPVADAVSVAPAASNASAVCKNGTVPNVERSECMRCPKGLFSVGGDCQRCPLNTFAPTEGLASCTGCVPGYVSAPDSQSCFPCPSGQYRSAAMATCERVAEGAMAPAASAGYTACGPGSIPNVFSSSYVCVPAESRGPVCWECHGVYAQNCFPCLPGSYRSVNMTGCEPVPPKSVSGPGQAEPTFCLPGTVPDGPKAACAPCLKGGYENDGFCETCPHNHISSADKATACEACPPGSVAAADQQKCVPCGTGLYRPENASDCIPVPPGAVALAGSPTYEVCEDGTVPNGPKSECVACGSYQANETCLVCGVNSVAPLPGSTACNLCKEGFVSVDGQECSPCLAGFYRHEPMAACAQAPRGAIALPGSRNYTVCEPGTVPDLERTACEPCTVEVEDECKACVGNTFSPVPGRTACLECEPGTVVDPDGQGCSPCRAGTFRSANMSSCSECLAGYVSKEGAAACTPCAPGTEARKGTSCELCRAGFYCVPPSAAAPCPDGFFSAAGSDSCEACPPGHISNADRTRCVECGGGTFQADGTVRRPAIGTWAPPATAGGCLECAPGWYPSNDSTRCIPCGSGTFMPEGTLQCVTCPRSRFAPREGTPFNCTECPAGFTSSPDRRSCLPCAPGFFRPARSSVDTCEPCPAAHVARAAGSAACAPWNLIGQAAQAIATQAPSRSRRRSRSLRAEAGAARRADLELESDEVDLVTEAIVYDTNSANVTRAEIKTDEAAKQRLYRIFAVVAGAAGGAVLLVGLLMACYIRFGVPTRPKVGATSRGARRLQRRKQVSRLDVLYTDDIAAAKRDLAERAAAREAARQLVAGGAAKLEGVSRRASVASLSGGRRASSVVEIGPSGPLGPAARTGRRGSVGVVSFGNVTPVSELGEPTDGPTQTEAAKSVAGAFATVIGVGLVLLAGESLPSFVVLQFAIANYETVQTLLSGTSPSAAAIAGPVEVSASFLGWSAGPSCFVREQAAANASRGALTNATAEGVVVSWRAISPVNETQAPAGVASAAFNVSERTCTVTWRCEACRVASTASAAAAVDFRLVSRLAFAVAIRYSVKVPKYASIRGVVTTSTRDEKLKQLTVFRGARPVAVPVLLTPVHFEHAADGVPQYDAALRQASNRDAELDETSFGLCSLTRQLSDPSCASVESVGFRAELAVNEVYLLVSRVIRASYLDTAADLASLIGTALAAGGQIVLAYFAARRVAQMRAAMFERVRGKGARAPALNTLPSPSPSDPPQPAPAPASVLELKWPASTSSIGSAGRGGDAAPPSAALDPPAPSPDPPAPDPPPSAPASSASNSAAEPSGDVLEPSTSAPLPTQPPPPPPLRRARVASVIELSGHPPMPEPAKPEPEFRRGRSSSLPLIHHTSGPAFSYSFSHLGLRDSRFTALNAAMSPAAAARRNSLLQLAAPRPSPPANEAEATTAAPSRRSSVQPPASPSAPALAAAAARRASFLDLQLPPPTSTIDIDVPPRSMSATVGVTVQKLPT
eukprot:tig00020805_g14023.t1